MQSQTQPGIDWRDDAAYAPLLDADRSLFAWEWLRRDPAYRAAAEAACEALSSARAAPAAALFGLVRFEPPHLSVPHARPLWRADFWPRVLSVMRLDESLAEDEWDVRRMAKLATVVAGQVGEHLLLSDGLRSIRVDGPGGAFSRGPACFSYRLEGLISAVPVLLTLRRFLALSRTGSFSRLLHRREVRARRWILMLRASDAVAAGADQRHIAEQLFSRSAGEPRWRSRESSVRSQAQRLVRSARAFADGSYRSLLR